MPLKVIGAGFGRTGTASLKQALEILGFDRCYHMFEVNKNLDGAQDWLDAANGKKVDWERVLDGYQSAVDWPACHFYREFHEHYPEAKVVLSVRDADKWYRSASETIYPMSHSMPRWFVRIVKKMRVMHEMIETIIWQGTFNGKFLSDPEHAKQVFNRHIDTVKRSIPAEQLLVFEVSQGWEPLCEFLGVEVPDVPFPRTNDAAQMKTQIKQIHRAFRIIHMTAGALVAALCGYLLLS